MPFAVNYPADTKPRVEGEPFYELAEYVLSPSGGDDEEAAAFCFRVRAFRELPFCDAVGLLCGDDQTGLIVWTGALAMIEWFVRGAPARVTSLLAPQTEDSVFCLELGCGCGVVTVALAQYLSSSGHSGRVQLLCTDGNEACVALAHKNVDAFCGDGCPIGCAADVLHWGLDATSAAYHDCLTRHGVRPGVWAGRLVILSADVIYDTAAIPLLVSTVRTLCTLLQGADGHASSLATWWLLYTPRSLTRAKNVALFEQLISSISAQPGWTVKRHRLPPHSLTTGFEAALASNVSDVGCAEAEMAADALLGCLVEVQLCAVSL